MNEKDQKTKKGMSMKGQRTLAYMVLIIISFFCLFWFYVLFINATRSNGALKKGFTAIPGGSSYQKLEKPSRRNTSGMEWYVQQYFHCYLFCCFMYLFLHHDCICHPRI